MRLICEWEIAKGFSCMATKNKSNPFLFRIQSHSTKLRMPSTAAAAAFRLRASIHAVSADKLVFTFIGMVAGKNFEKYLCRRIVVDQHSFRMNDGESVEYRGRRRYTDEYNAQKIKHTAAETAEMRKEKGEGGGGGEPQFNALPMYSAFKCRIANSHASKEAAAAAKREEGFVLRSFLR